MEINRFSSVVIHCITYFKEMSSLFINVFSTPYPPLLGEFGRWARAPRRCVICAELLCREVGCVFAGTPTGEYTVRNGDAAGKVSIAADSHGIPPRCIQAIDG